MPLIDQVHSDELEKLARSRFDPELAEAELKVVRDSASSTRPGVPDADAPRPVVRAEFLRWQATDGDAVRYIDPLGLRAYGVTLPGDLNFGECRIAFPLDFRMCTFEGGLDLSSAELRDLLLVCCSVKGAVQAGWLDVIGSVVLNGSRFASEVSMMGARMSGDLHFHASAFEVNGVNALSADGIHVGGNFQFHHGSTSNGVIRLLGAQIGGGFDCAGARIEVSEGLALFADGVQVGRTVLLAAGFSATGTISLHGARIGGPLDCSGAKLEVKHGDAICAHRASIDGGVFLSEGFTSTGNIGLLYSRIRAGLFCAGASLMVKGGNALSADGAEIAGAVHLDKGFSSTGEVVLRSAQLRGGLFCSGGKFCAKGDALTLEGARIDGSVFLREGFECPGTVGLVNTVIGGNLLCTGARIAVMDCLNMSVGGDFVWQRVEKSADTKLGLFGARIKTLRDDRGSWPEEGKLDLRGLVYEELTTHRLQGREDVAGKGLGDEPLVAGERIKWLMLQRPDKRREPQPWMQLRGLLEEKGDSKGAKHVLYRFRCLQAQESSLISRRLKIAFAWLEESPQRILWFVGFTLLLFTCIFRNAGAQKAIAPTEKEAYEPFAAEKPIPLAYPRFSPFIYTLENALPLVRFGEDEKWAPDPNFPSKSWLTNYWFLMWMRWALVVWGWFQAGILGAAIIERFRPMQS